ncbi:MAG: glycosyltransferase family 2 protein [Paracoccaceae bacterium]
MTADSDDRAAAPAPVVSIIVVSYNTREMTLDCLRSVAAETRLPYELIVIDNASADGSAGAIAAEFPELRLLAETANHGFARANNIAAGHARGEYILLLNPDTVVLDGAIDKLVAFARERPEAKIWGGRTLYGDGSLNPTNCWRQMSLWSVLSQFAGLSSLFRDSAIFNPEGYGGWRRDSEREVDIVTGCFFLIGREFWNRLGGFDLRYVMYGEEADLCRRARALGARPRITPAAEIIHYVGASETVRARKMVKLLKAKVTLAHRIFPSWQRWPALGLLRLWPLSRLLATGLLARLTGKARWREAHAGWREIWDRRRDWMAGYPAGGGTGT